jgi:hypothetical protein
MDNATIAIVRQSKLGFTLDPSKPSGVPSGRFCWKLVAGSKSAELTSPPCPPAAAPVPAQGAVKHSTKKEDPPPGEVLPGPVSGTNVVSATVVGGAPDQVLLVQPPNGAIYRLDVPKAKTDDSGAPKPVTLKQFDSAWIDIPKLDLAKVAYVEANQLHLKTRPAKSGGDGKPAKGFQAEVTRELTAKPGDIDVTVVGKDGTTLGSVKVQISCAHCNINGGQ